MQKTLRNSRGRSLLLHLPTFTSCPPARCFEPVERSVPIICGERASWKREGNDWFGDAYFCENHRQESDVPIVGDLVIRRVRVSCDVLLAGVSHQAPACQAEALARLEAAIAQLGGVLDVSRVISTVGRYASQPGAGEKIASEGDAG